MAGVTLEIRGKTEQYAAAMRQSMQLTERYQRKIKALGAEGKKAAREEKELGKERKRAYDEVRGPAERYQRRMRALNDLVKKGTFTQKEYAIAARRAHQRLEGAGQAGHRAFGASAIDEIKSMAMGFGAVSAAVGLVTKTLREMDQVRQDAAQKLIESMLATTQLAQLSKGDPKKTDALIQAGREVYAGGAIANRTQAMQVAFALESVGMLDQAKFVGEAGPLIGTAGVGGVVTSAGKVSHVFGAKKAGNLRQILSKAEAAAGPVGGVNMATIMQATAESAGPAKAMGLSNEELFAAVSVATEVYNPREAKTAVSRMLDQIAIKRPELAGRPLKEILTTLRDEHMSAKEANKLLGIRGLKAKRTVTPELYLGRLSEIEAAQASDLVTASIKEAERAGGSALLERRAAVAKELAGEPLGEARNRSKAWVETQQAKLLRNDQELESMALGAAAATARVAVGSRGMEGNMSVLRTSIPGQTVEAMLAHYHPGFMALFRAADALQGAANAFDNSARSRPPVTVSEE